MRIRRRRIKVEIPTASQSDIAFLLIIFFLITTSFALKTGIVTEIAKKTDQQKEINKSEIGIISITPTKFIIGKREVSKENLSAALQHFPFKKIIIKIDKGTKYVRVVEVVSVLQEKDVKISMRVRK